MRFSYSAIWDDAVRLLKSNASLLTAVAGVFLLLPELLLAYFVPMPEAKTYGEFVRLMTEYLEKNWHVLLLVNVTGTIGAITMLELLLGRHGTSVGEAIRRALPLLIPYLVASLLLNLMVGFAALLLLLPGFYLFARFVPVLPALVAENRRNPIEALQRGFALSRGRGFVVLGLIVIIVVAGYLVTFATSRVVGAIFLLAAGTRIGGLLSLILDAALGAAFSTMLLVLFAAIYLKLSGDAQPPARSNGI